LSSTTPSPFTRGWSHYALLLTIKNPEDRQHLRVSIPTLSAFQGRSETTLARVDRGDQR
jgi:hypothetical protein